MTIADTARFGKKLAVFDVIENWLDRERDQLPLWVPVGIGVGIAIWQFGAISMLPVFVLACTAIALTAMLAPSGSRLRFILQMVALTICAGFALISLRSANVAQPVLGDIWIGDFYGRIEAVENISARNVYRLRLATGPKSGLPPFVRVNLSPEQYEESFQPGSVVRLRARLLPPAGPALPGGYDFGRRAWFQQIGATGSALGEVYLHQAASSRPLFATQREALTQHVLRAMPARDWSYWRCVGDRRSGAHKRSGCASHA